MLDDCMEDDGAKKTCRGMCCCGVFVALLVVISCSFGKVASTEYGLAYDTIWAKLGDTVLDEGLKTKPTFGTIIIWPSVYQTADYSGATSVDCNSADGVVVNLDFSFNYVPLREEIIFLTETYKNFDEYKKNVFSQARASVRHSCGNYTAIDFQKKRDEVQIAMTNAVRTAVRSNFKAEVATFELRNIDRPRAFEAAVEEKENASSDIKLAGNEREGALINAERDERLALDVAKQIRDAANTTAKINLKVATTEAAIITDRYTKLGEALKRFKDMGGLSDVGVLAYLNNLVVSAKGGLDQYVGMKHASQVNYQAEVDKESA